MLESFYKQPQTQGPRRDMRLTFELLLFQAKPLGNLDRAVFLKKWDQNHVEKTTIAI